MTCTINHVLRVMLAAGLLAAPTMFAGCKRATPSRDPQSALITVRRTRCYGFCPAYSVTVAGDGRVKYAGEYYVDIPGVQTSNIAPEKVKLLLTAFDEIHFLSLDSKYTSYCTDNPTTYVSLAVDGKSKVVENYFCDNGASATQIALEKLARQVDETTNVGQWIKCETACLATLVPAGLEVNSVGPSGDTPLMVAVDQHSNLGSVRLLLNARARIDVADDQGHTPLMLAAMHNNAAIARELLAHGANVNATDLKGFPALDMVSQGTEVYKVLMEAGGKHKAH